MRTQEDNDLEAEICQCNPHETDVFLYIASDKKDGTVSFRGMVREALEGCLEEDREEYIAALHLMAAIISEALE